MIAPWHRCSTFSLPTIQSDRHQPFDEQIFDGLNQYYAIWFDTEPASEKKTQRQCAIQTVIGPVVICRDLLMMERKIQQFNDRRILIILNGQADRALLLRIHHHISVAFILIYCRNIQFYAHVRLGFPKVSSGVSISVVVSTRHLPTDSNHNRSFQRTHSHSTNVSVCLRTGAKCIDHHRCLSGFGIDQFPIASLLDHSSMGIVVRW
jgi:hypothetical protein